MIQPAWQCLVDLFVFRINFQIECHSLLTEPVTPRAL
jgi:hypothetical protein